MSEVKVEESIIGIDLGTSNSAASVMISGRPTLIPSSEGSMVGGKVYPSIVAINADGELLVGEYARRQMVENPKGTITHVKRQMGKKVKLRLLDKVYSPEQLSGFILQKIKSDAELFLGHKVKKAVVTVPAYFNDLQRQATMDAGKIAELDIVRIINEPTAAALAYGFDKQEDCKMLVFDFGGGTLDVTIMELSKGVFEVLSTSGDTELGGGDMDRLIQNEVVGQFKKEHGIDLFEDKTAFVRVKEECEKAKIELSNTLKYEINLPYIATSKTNAPLTLKYVLTRSFLNGLISEIIKKCKKPIDQALKDAKLSVLDVSKVILVGGPTKMPAVYDFLVNIFGKAKINTQVNPMECVSLGAAIQGGILMGTQSEILLLDVVPLSLGIEIEGGLFSKIIPRNTTIPTKRTQQYTNAADQQTIINIAVYQGEREFVADNKYLGGFMLTGITPMRRGEAKVDVTFDVDVNGMLNIHAKENVSNVDKSIAIEKPSKFSDSEIEKMVEEAKQFADKDKEKKDYLLQVHQSEEILRQADTLLKDEKISLSEEVKKEIEGVSVELKNLISSNAPIKELQEKSIGLMQIMSKQKQQSQEGTNQAEQIKTSKEETEEILDATDT